MSFHSHNVIRAAIRLGSATLSSRLMLTLITDNLPSPTIRDQDGIYWLLTGHIFSTSYIVLLNYHFNHAHTPPLVSRKFPSVPLGLGGSLFGYKERRYWANRPFNLFPRLPTYVITIHQRHRRTDRRMTCDCKTALCTKVHCAVKIMKLPDLDRYNEPDGVTS